MTPESQNAEWKSSWRDVTYQAADAAARGTTQKTTQKTTQERILDYLKAEPTLTRRALAERVGLTEEGVKYHLTRLKAAGAPLRWSYFVGQSEGKVKVDSGWF